MLTDDELGTMIGDRLRTEVADLRPAPGLAATVRRRYARRTVALRGGIATALAAAAAAAVATTSALTPVAGGAGPPAGTTSAAPPVDPVAFVTGQTEAALAKADQYVLHERTTTGPTGVTTERWSSGGKWPAHIITYDRAGRPDHEFAAAPTEGRGMVTVEVDHASRTWWTTTVPDAGGKADPDARGNNSPEAIHAAITSGTVRLLGPERADGRDTLHLRLTNLPMKAEQRPVIDLWVDPASYQVLRQTMSVDGQTRATTTYEWLPRTAPNLAKLTLTAPAGYAHTTGPKTG